MNGRASTRIQLVATLVFAALLTAGLAAATAALRPRPACTQVLIASSQEKFLMLSAFAVQYNRAARSVDGRCVSVTVEQVNSGDAELLLETGWVGRTHRPDVWSPASSAWVRLLAYRSRQGAALLPTPLIYEKLFQSPLVIGMPEPMASALRYPTTPIGWADILKLSQDPTGWGRYSHPEWGRFLSGKTNPTVSTSGLHALIGSYFAATGGNLTPGRVTDAKVNAFVGGVESSVVHYGNTVSIFFEGLRAADAKGAALSYVSAIATEEKELIDYNNGIVGGVQGVMPKVKLVPIYPSEGVPVADHPYIVLAWAASKARAAQSFYDFLQTPESLTTVDRNGFRYASGIAGPDMHKQEFVNTTLPSRVIQSPEGEVLNGMLKAWHTIRKPARVLIVIDVSANAAALQQVTARLAAAVGQFQARDSVGVWTFPAPAATYTELRPVSQVTDGLESTLKAIAPFRGLSNLGPVVETAVKEMAKSYDGAKVDAVLLVEMSPGDTLPTDKDIKFFLASQSPTKFVRLFTVGPAGNARLMDLAVWGQGIAYDPGTTTHLLNDVITNF